MRRVASPPEQPPARSTLAISAPPRATAAGSRSVLIVDDEAAICRALDRVLRAAGFAVMTATDPLQALDLIMHQPFDVVLSDVMMPRMTGVDFLRVLRAYDLDVPVILMTGNPTVDTAVEAVQLGALQYLPKPIPNDVVVAAVARASRLHQIAVMKREAMTLLAEAENTARNKAQLDESFDRALATMWMAFQPIVDHEGRVFGYEALLRSKEPSLPHPGAVLDAADALGRHEELGRHVRALSAEAFAASPPDVALFVNLHVRDLLDQELYASDSALGRIADRVVLEITERAAMDTVKDIGARIAVLRYQGYRIAIDDLGAGYAGLSSFAALEPEIVKLDMSLVRNAHTSPMRRQLVESISTLCRSMNIDVVAEGIETAEEHTCMLNARCTLLQGYRFAKPGPPFPPVAI